MIADVSRCVELSQLSHPMQSTRPLLAMASSTKRLEELEKDVRSSVIKILHTRDAMHEANLLRGNTGQSFLDTIQHEQFV
jgi:hypothetical protein